MLIFMVLNLLLTAKAADKLQCEDRGSGRRICTEDGRLYRTRVEINRSGDRTIEVLSQGKLVFKEIQSEHRITQDFTKDRLQVVRDLTTNTEWRTVHGKKQAAWYTPPRQLDKTATGEGSSTPADTGAVGSLQYSFDIKASCLKDVEGGNPLGIENFLNTVMKEGVSCLSKLNTDLSQVIKTKVLSLFQGAYVKPSVSCGDEEKYRPFAKKTAAAYAYITPKDPRIYVRPDLWKEFATRKKAAFEVEMKNILFHEVLHSAGFPHNFRGVDRVYACANYCFPVREDGEYYTELARRVCSAPESELKGEDVANFYRNVSSEFEATKTASLALENGDFGSLARAGNPLAIAFSNSLEDALVDRKLIAQRSLFRQDQQQATIERDRPLAEAVIDSSKGDYNAAASRLLTFNFDSVAENQQPFYRAVLKSTLSRTIGGLPLTDERRVRLIKLYSDLEAGD